MLALLGLAHPVAFTTSEQPRLFHCPALLKWHLSLGSKPSWSQRWLQKLQTPHTHSATAEKPGDITSFLVPLSNFPKLLSQKLPSRLPSCLAGQEFCHISLYSVSVLGNGLAGQFWLSLSQGCSHPKAGLGGSASRVARPHG